MKDEELVHALTFAAMLVYIGYKTGLVVKARIKKREDKRRVYALMRFGAGKLHRSEAFLERASRVQE